MSEADGFRPATCAPRVRDARTSCLVVWAGVFVMIRFSEVMFGAQELAGQRLKS